MTSFDLYPSVQFRGEKKKKQSRKKDIKSCDISINLGMGLQEEL